MMAMYFKGLCNGAALLVQDHKDADVDMFDSDVLASKKALEPHLHEQRLRPVIVLSVQDFVRESYEIIFHLTIDS
jgi:hypothetical protein